MEEAYLKALLLRFVGSLLVFALLGAVLSPPAVLAWKQRSTSGIKEKTPRLNPEERYTVNKTKLAQLLANDGPQQNRSAWLPIVDAFHEIAVQQNPSELAMKSLYMQAQTCQAMYVRFHQQEDVESARKNYLLLADRYANGFLADDALYKAALLTSDVKDQRPTAQQLYQQILSSYPHSDHAPKAQEQLQQPAVPSPSSSRDSAAVAPSASSVSTAASPAKVQSAMHATAPAQPQQGPARIEPLLFWLAPNYARIVVQASNQIPFHIRREGSHLFIDFKGATLTTQPQTDQQLQHSVLREYKLNQPVFGQVRADLDVAPSFTYKTFTLTDPFRVVVDIAVSPELTQSSQPALATQPLQPAAAREVPFVPPPKLSAAEVRKKYGPQLSLAQQLGLGVKTIVIDPGHGGKDPGAIAFGLQEKNITLAIAKKLKQILTEQYHYNIILTRTKDVFVPLEKRTALANKQKADLFISIHLNANASSSYHGTETYFLNLATDADAMRVAAMENATSTHNIGEMQDILNKIMKNAKVKESSNLAKFIQNDLIHGSYGAYQVRNLGVKQAPFYVLIGAKMPAILTEITFITNPTEANFLKSDQYLDSIAQQLAKGIIAYVEHQRLASVAAKY